MPFWNRAPAPPSPIRRETRRTGFAFFAPASATDATPTRWIDAPGTFGEASSLVSLLAQLEEEGFAQYEAGRVDLPWEALYALSRDDHYATAVQVLQLPSVTDATPRLQSQGALTDTTFGIGIVGWQSSSGHAIETRADLLGAVIELDSGAFLLSEASWRLAEAIASFASLSPKSAQLNREHWGRIRQLAVAAGAGLDDFLARTVVLTPEKLRLSLRKTEVGRTTVVEVEPQFEGAPSAWLSRFDAYSSVQDRYELPEHGGLTQIVIRPEVRTVLAEIKRMPGRRVAGRRAEAFVRNPYGVLGEDAATVLPEAEFQQAREDAGIAFNQFSVEVTRDDEFIVGVALIVNTVVRGTPVTERLPFAELAELDSFIGELGSKLARGMQCCVWRGWELELLGDADSHLETLKQASEEWKRPRALVRLKDVYDLSHYSERIERIGIEKSYYLPFIAKKDDGEGWFPENVTIGLLWTPPGEAKPTGVSLGPEQLESLKKAFEQAETQGAGQLTVAGLPKPISTTEARSIIESLGAALDDVKQCRFDPNKARDGTPSATKKKGLVAKANISTLDYAEKRVAALALDPSVKARLPKALRDDVRLLQHQLEGIARLQSYWRKTPDICRGSLLADDMGLGKTVQLLTFIASCLEAEPQLDPVLVVAPVSLLENWNAEIRKFLRPGFAKVATLYGDALAGKKVPRSQIETQLVQDGLTSFLKPNWLDGANIVLTTYETLRDLEFSFAKQRWSIMVCDEAQRIKNPNALVTRSAKKQNVRFRIACTGTPVENTLADLWCLFDYIQPGLLGALNEFGLQYRRPIEAKTQEERIRVEELRAIVMPQIIRRLKKDVAKDLPNKIEVDTCKAIPMSIFQRNLYAHAINQFRGARGANGRTPFANHLRLLQYLRAVCAHPRPYGQETHTVEALPSYCEKSPKMRWLLTQLKDIARRKEKAIVFTEFRDLQRLIQHYIQESFGVHADIINGDTAATSKVGTSRQGRIDAFQSKPGFGVLILSPLAVGVGVNIQGANHVIHYTRTWNPSKEDQATDRAYRIGQMKDVYVYYPTLTALGENGEKLFTSFEDRLDWLLNWKRQLSEDMLNGSGDLAGTDFGPLAEVEGEPVFEGKPVTVDDIVNMDDVTFEFFCAVLWKERGYNLAYRTPQSGDGGVDVVAINGRKGALVQAKTSGSSAELGWEAVKDVVAGEAAYRAKHPGVAFTKYAATNQRFNETARLQAGLNNVELVDQATLLQWLESHPVDWLVVEQMRIECAR